MAARHCINHPDVPAVGHCYQCHRPICNACRYPTGSPDIFCSEGCYDQYLAYQSRRRPEASGSPLRGLGVALFVLAALGLAVFIGGAMGIPVLEDIREAIRPYTG